MEIREIHMKNFGKFRDKKMTFSPGLNVIYGENESGKTTIQNFIMGMMFGMEKPRGRGSQNAPYEKYEPWEAPAYYEGTLRFSTGGQEFCLERNFYHKEKTERLVNVRDGEELSVAQGDLQMLLGGISRDAYENTFLIRQEQPKPGTALKDCLDDELQNLAKTGDGSFQLSKVLQHLQTERKNLTAQLKELEKDRTHQIEVLQAEEKVLAGQQEQLRERMDRQRQGMKPPKSGIRAERRRSPENEMAQMRYFHPAAALGLVLSLAWFLVWRQGTVSLPLWLVGQIVLLIVFIAGLRATAKKASRRETADTGVVDTEDEKQQAVLQVLGEEFREKEMELENNRSRQKELQSVTGEMKALYAKQQAISLAEETLVSLAAQGGKENAGLLNAAAAEIFGQITNGKYRDVTFSKTYEPQVMVGEKRRNPKDFSGGTVQQLYFATRMAAGKFLEKEEELPFLLDEPFAGYDSNRMSEALQWLGGQERQILLFTCQEREKECLEELQLPFSYTEL